MCTEVDGHDHTKAARLARDVARENSLDAAFEQFLLTRRDHRDGLSARQQLWMAFKAGGEWAIKEIRS